MNFLTTAISTSLCLLFLASSVPPFRNYFAVALTCAWLTLALSFPSHFIFNLSFIYIFNAILSFYKIIIIRIVYSAIVWKKPSFFLSTVPFSYQTQNNDLQESPSFNMKNRLETKWKTDSKMLPKCLFWLNFFWKLMCVLMQDGI